MHVFRQSCPLFWKKAILIYSEGRQPCPFWRLIVHGKYSGCRQFMFPWGMQSMCRKSMSILEQAVHFYSKDKQTRSTLKIGSPCLFWRQAVHGLWISVVHVYTLKNGHLDSPYLYWRQAVHVLCSKAVHVNSMPKTSSPYSKDVQSMSILVTGSFVSLSQAV